MTGIVVLAFLSLWKMQNQDITTENDHKKYWPIHSHILGVVSKFKYAIYDIFKVGL